MEEAETSTQAWCEIIWQNTQTSQSIRFPPRSLFYINRSYLINTIKHKVNLDLATQWRKSGKGKRECCLLDWNVSLDAGLSKHSIVFLTWREKQLDASPTCGL